MAFVHGKASIFKLDNSSSALTDIKAKIDNLDFPETIDTAEVTAFGNNSRAYVVGLKSATISFSGPWDGVIDAHLSAIRGRALTVSFEYSPESTTTGYRVYTGEAILTSFQKTSPVSGRVSYSAALQITGDVTATTH